MYNHIREEQEKLKLPVYELIGTTLRIRFQALESALIDQLKVSKYQSDTLADKIIALLKEKIERKEMQETHCEETDNAL